ncbi:hypothetical protein HA402_010481 [Bradysia odoriphaga]|nr:hypothetical protein HA402_010481 [Bradysia odoriphaga]
MEEKISSFGGRRSLVTLNIQEHVAVHGAILFYGSNFNHTYLPVPRSTHHLWAFFREESPENVPLLMYDIALSFFNVTATFKQNSDYTLTLQYLDDYKTLISRKYIYTVEQKNHYQQDELLAPVLYMQSICDTMSGRDQYINELHHINIDSYGNCLNNKELPESVCNDYVTEKIWRGVWRTLIVGSVPVYFGAPNIKTWLPNNKSAILIDFKTPKELAEFLLNLNENDIEYNTYL